MKPGDIVLLRIPESSLATGKRRPVLLLGVLPGRHGDWLICGVSSKLAEAVPGWDELLEASDPEFPATGLKVASVARLNWLATVSPTLMNVAPLLGSISIARTNQLRQRLGDHLTQDIP